MNWKCESFTAGPTGFHHHPAETMVCLKWLQCIGGGGGGGLGGGGDDGSDGT